MASSRFPGKPMAEIMGMPMIGHVYHRSKMCSLLDEVYVATCDREIEDYVKSIGGKAIMTANTHERASDRVAEAMLKIENQTDQKIDIVVLLQGDEPMIFPEMIEAAVQPLLDDKSVTVSNLMAEMNTVEEHEDPNEVKVVVDNNSFALYFSREPIPSRKKYDKAFTMLKQVCLMPFTRKCLLDYTNLEPTPLEIIESVDMNRFLEHGIKVKMIRTEYKTYAVDTEVDLKHVEKLMKSDKRIGKYHQELKKK